MKRLQRNFNRDKIKEANKRRSVKQIFFCSWASVDTFLADVVQSHQSRVCIPAQEPEMLAVSKGKALFHLAFVSILDPCSSHHRKGKTLCPAATGQFRAG